VTSAGRWRGLRRHEAHELLVEEPTESLVTPTYQEPACPRKRGESFESAMYIRNPGVKCRNR
jgi:hypothetical protein